LGYAARDDPKQTGDGITNKFGDWDAVTYYDVKQVSVI
jgi:hypothetical protein